MDRHKKCLLSLCRVCSKLISSRARRTKDCTECATAIKEAFSIDIANDSSELHPSKLCESCIDVISRHKVAKEAGRMYRSTQNVVSSWPQHFDESCYICDLHFKLSKPGRHPAKRKKLLGPPKRSSVRALEDFLHSIALPPFKLSSFSQKLYPDFVTESNSSHVIEQLLCFICGDITERPIDASCHHIACMTCLVKQYGDLHSGEDWTCSARDCFTVFRSSNCHLSFSELGTFAAVHKLVDFSLRSLEVRCSKGCGAVFSYGSLKEHVCQPVHHLFVTPLRRVRSLENISSIATPDTVQKKQAGAVIQRLLSKKRGTTDDIVLSLPTGNRGQTLNLANLGCPRIPSDRASSRTLRDRTARLERLRACVSGGAVNDASSRAQLRHEVNRTTKEERRDLLRDAGFIVSSGQQMDVGTGLALKADLGLPWARLRILRRWLSNWGVRIPGEQKDRELMRELVPEDIRAEMTVFSFKSASNVILRPAPLVYIDDLSKAIASALEELNSSGELTWHDCIPDNKIWVKIGGDHGGGSFKFSFQLGNAPLVNSVHNVQPICCFKAGDSKTNLEVALGRYRSQVQEISSLSWRDKSIDFFVFGDYEFLSRLYGISGACGFRPCLWCLCTKQETQTSLENRDRGQPRLLESLRRDHSRYSAAGSKLKLAKRFNNVIAPALFDIELDHVALPALHISLGIFCRLFSLFMDACRSLDDKVAKKNQEDREEHRKAEDKARRLEEKAAFFLQELAWSCLSSSENQAAVNELKEEAALLQQRAKAIREAANHLLLTAEAEVGMCVKAVEEAISQCKIDRQMYFGGTFLGNHVQKALKEKNINVICNSIRDLAYEDPAIIVEAEAVSKKCRTAFTLFRRCHALYSLCRKLSESEIDELDMAIKDFMRFYRESFESSIIPKMHFLEDHAVPWIQQWKVGLSFHGEQAAESIHAVFNKDMRPYASIRDPLKKLKLVFTNYYAKHSANLRKTFPKS